MRNVSTKVDILLEAADRVSDDLVNFSFSKDPCINAKRNASRDKNSASQTIAFAIKLTLPTALHA